jgi:hypothetical protein
MSAPTPLRSPLDCANGPTGSDQWDLVLDATATKWSLDVAQMTSRLDYQKMETMAESARRVGSLSPSLT